MLSNLQIGNKKPLTGIHQYANNTKIKKFQIITSQSQKNIKSGLTPGKKIETKSRPNTGGSKSPFMPMNRPLSYKDKFSLSNNQGKSTNDSKQNESNLSLNISAIKTIKLNDKQSLSSNRSGYKNGVTNLNLGKSLNNNNMFKARGIKVGPQTTRELSTKNTIVNDSKSKQKSLLNESKSLNNSVSDAIVGNQTRSHSQNLKTTKNSNQGLFGKTNSYSKSPNNRNPPSKKINTKGEKTLNEEKSRSPSPLLSSSYLKKFNNHSNKVPNFSKISTGNLINDKKFRDEQMDVQITNNTKKKSQNNFSMSKLKPNITKFSGNTPLLQNKNDTFEAEPRVNPKKELDLKHRDVDLRKITTSPIKKPINLKNENKINQLHTPNIMLVNKEQLSNSNSTQETIKTIKNIHDITKTGFSGTGVKKVNQDNFFIYKNFNSNPNSIYFGVCDGHGVLGHEVSAFLRENLPATVDSELKKRLKKDEINKILDDVFVFTNNKLCNQTMIDTNFRYMEDNISGSTCVTLIYTPEKLICANVGDSRAVLGRCVNGSWTNQDLSRDHKPSDKDESERIIKRKGRIEPFRDENNEFIGPARVWLKDDDIPGLAMSRSFGDQVAGSVGVIAEPEISEWKFTKDDMFFIIASDGVWEFIESEECVNIIKPYYLNNDIQGAAEYIVKESTRRWLKEEEVIDDITLLLVFLN